MSSSLKQQLKILQSKKQYEAMIALLEASDEPNKKVIISRIKLRMKEEAKATAELTPVPAPLPVKTGKLPLSQDARLAELKRGNRVFRTAALIVVLIVVAAVPIGHAINSYINRYQWRMEDVCQEVYRDDWLDGEYTFNQWYYGCQGAAKQSIDFYGQEIAYCYNAQNGTDRMFQQCLIDEGVSIYSTSLRETAP